VPYTIPIYNWTGFYAGLHTGYSWGFTDIDYLSGGALVAQPKHHNGGLLLGGQVGYNFQWGQFVAGIEADAAWRGGTANSTHIAANGLDFTDHHSGQGWLTTLRPRAGWAVNNFLLYGTGGVALGGVEHSFTERRPTVAGASRTISEDVTRGGWTIGAGVEAGFSQWSLGLEYLYVDLGKSTLNMPTQTISGVTFPGASSTFDDRSHTVRAKVNYRWGGPPIIANY
jgi:outer membrane immunogenic protein